MRSGGQPVSGARVMVTNPAAPAGGTSGTTSTDGSFRFNNLAPGTYTMLADVTVVVRAKPTEGARANATRVLLVASAQPGAAPRPAQVQPLTLGEPARLGAVVPGNYPLSVSPLEVTPSTTDGCTPAPRSRCDPLTIPQQPAEQELLVALPLL